MTLKYLARAYAHEIKERKKLNKNARFKLDNEI